MKRISLVLLAASSVFAQTRLINNIGNFIHDVGDLDRSVKFYHDVLGMEMPRPAGDWQTGEPVLKLYNAVGGKFRVANTQVTGSPMRVELAEFSGVDRKPVKRSWGTAGNSVLILSVADLKPIEERIKANNVPLLVKPAKGCDGRGLVVADPDGFPVMLVERPGLPGMKFGYLTSGDGLVKNTLAALGVQPESRTYQCPPVEGALLGGKDVTVATMPGGFEVWLATGKKAEKHVAPRPQDPGAGVLRFAVTDVDAAVAALQRVGLTIASAGGEIQSLSPGGARAVILRAADDLFVQVVK